MRGRIDSNHGTIAGSLAALPLRTGARLLFVACALVLALSACDDSFDSDGSHSVNGSLHVPADKEPIDVTTMNGSIRIDENAAVLSATTVNGGIHVGAHATAVTLKTVNGSITLGSGAHVSAGVG